MFDQFRAKRKLQKLVKGNIDEILSKKNKAKPKKKIIHCALLQVRYNENFDDYVESINDTIGRIDRINGVPWCIMNSLIYATFDDDAVFNIDSLRSVLTSLVNNNTKIVGCSSEGIYTSLGEKNRFSYEPVLVKFDDLISTLSKIEYGALTIL
jgi:hypothetical protein